MRPTCGRVKHFLKKHEAMLRPQNGKNLCLQLNSKLRKLFRRDAGNGTSGLLTERVGRQCVAGGVLLLTKLNIVNDYCVVYTLNMKQAMRSGCDFESDRDNHRRRHGLSTTNASILVIRSKAIASMKTSDEHTRSSCFPISCAIKVIGMVVAVLQFNRRCANQMNQCLKNLALLRAQRRRATLLQRLSKEGKRQ